MKGAEVQAIVLFDSYYCIVSTKNTKINSNYEKIRGVNLSDYIIRSNT